ncbi:MULTISPECIES: hypothetical protein [unclassified Paenibacillus]|uniref:hypothetical protein n=1 Tax=unclassified Paenibacillus TaxID=185978 RepID=UPI0003E24273|nr:MULTISPECIES: hypothetical protein [unclassified Paenibacillus]ETT46623.1 hypothetical protein C162_19239 [Paenibacillus sp. FSL R7-269]OMF87477.1 hypothetical protein BK147_28480 [Paenibacillus sp. FSL R7-0337]
MKLKGTLTEQAYREELIASKFHLFNDMSRRRFLNIIRKTFPAMKTAYVLSWIPDQGEDIISFLVDTHSVIKIELDRYDNTVTPLVDVYPIEHWMKGLSKTFQIKILVALDLAKNDMYQGN